MSEIIVELFMVVAKIGAFIEITEQMYFTALQKWAASFITPTRHDMPDVMGKIPYLHLIQAPSL